MAASEVAGRQVWQVEGKVIVVGDSSCGKSSLIHYLVKGEYFAGAAPSVGAAYSKKTVSTPDCTVHFQVWDTAGQEKFKSMNSIYFRNAAAAVLVFDVTEPLSFAHISDWITYVQKYAPTDVIMLLAANKIDLKGARRVSSEEARAFAAAHGMLYVESSARTGAGVMDIFTAIAREAPKYLSAENGNPSSFRLLSMETKSLVLDGADAPKRSSKCC